MKLGFEYDGITHVNVYSQGLTNLGRWLSNFTQVRFVTEEGEFNSIEGYWYYLSCPEHPDKHLLQTAHGYEAKKLGRALRANDWVDDPKFKAKILDAIDMKLLCMPDNIKEEWLFKYPVPLVHYYLYGSRVVEVPQGDWIIEFLNKRRLEWQNSN